VHAAGLTRAAVATAAVLAALAAGCGDDDEPAQAPERASPPAELRGTWGGRLTQRDLDPFRVRVTIEGPDGNPVRYSGLDCSGTWHYLGPRGDSFRFRETIDAGRSDTCKGVGVVTVTPAGGRLRYDFRGGGVESMGLLSRID
jgi:hypothetical protein